MIRFQKQESKVVYWTIFASATAVFVTDCLTPLGAAVWLFYFIPVGMSLYLWQPLRPAAVAAVCSALTFAGLWLSPRSVQWPFTIGLVNRAMLVCGLWITAAVGHQFIVAKLKIREHDWILAGHALLTERMMQSDGTLPALGDTILRTVCEYLDIPVAALYAPGPERSLDCIATYAGREPLPMRGSIAVGQGLVGRAFQDRRIIRLNDVPPGYLAIHSALGVAQPRQIVIVPVIVEGQVTAIAEFGFSKPASTSDMHLLTNSSESIASSIRAAQDRARQAELLGETLRQAEELRTQEEELRVSNEELEEHSHALKESQAFLETQQAELEETNSQLELQTQILEEQKEKLTRAHLELVKKSEELAQASRYKSEFLANMSHELRTPLNSALILAKLLADNKGGNLTAEQVAYANTIHSAGNDLLTLINDILDLSRIEAGRMEVNFEPVEVTRLVRSLKATFEPIANQSKVGFEILIGEGVPAFVTTDGTRLQQILRNLLSNAFKFTEVGSIHLEIATASEDCVSFSVRDTGIGISEEQQDVIFEAFRQGNGNANRKYGGTGLGLAISRELVTHLRGSLSVQSHPGSGSVFTLVLPVSAVPKSESVPKNDTRSKGPPKTIFKSPGLNSVPQPARANAITSSDKNQGTSEGHRLILIIEDDPAFAGILVGVAEEAKFRALVASTASEGLRLVEQCNPSAILLDLRLPDNSGLVVLERLKCMPQTRHIPVHVISAFDYSHQVLQMGAIGYSVKPVGREQILEAISRIESRLRQAVGRILIVESEPAERERLVQLLESKNVSIVPVATGTDARAQLASGIFDCMVLDLDLPDMSGFDLLDELARAEIQSLPPVIVHTGRTLGPSDEEQLRRFASSIIIKGAKSSERLLEEVTLFLHEVESNLPNEQQRILRELRNRESAMQGKSVLVVDDDVRSLFALAGALESRGANPLLARDGKEALTKLGEATSEATGVDLVLMDVMMPEMDGLTAMREIRKQPQWRRLPIIALTAKAMPNDRTECLAAGADDYVSKPIDIDRVFSLIRVWITK